jgi:hypothetical protein
MRAPKRQMVVGVVKGALVRNTLASGVVERGGSGLETVLVGQWLVGTHLVQVAGV